MKQDALTKAKDIKMLLLGLAYAYPIDRKELDAKVTVALAFQD